MAALGHLATPGTAETPDEPCDVKEVLTLSTGTVDNFSGYRSVTHSGLEAVAGSTGACGLLCNKNLSSTVSLRLTRICVPQIFTTSCG